MEVRLVGVVEAPRGCREEEEPGGRDAEEEEEGAHGEGEPAGLPAGSAMAALSHLRWGGRHQARRATSDPELDSYFLAE